MSMSDDEILKAAERIKAKQQEDNELELLLSLLNKDEWMLDCEVTARRKGKMGRNVLRRYFHDDSIKALLEKEIQIRKDQLK